MKIFAVILLIIGTLFALSESAKAVALFFYAGSFLSFLSYLVGSSLEGQEQHTSSMKKHAANRFNASERKKDRYAKGDSHLTGTLAGVAIAASMVDDDESQAINDYDSNGLGFDDNNHISAFDDDISCTSSISNTLDETETMYVNPATGLPMIGGIGGIDAGGDVYGSDLMSDMRSSIDDSSILSDNLTSSTDSFDSFDSSNSIGCDDSFGTDDSFSSFDDSFSSMDDDW